ncbi:aquaporin [Candidatus Saccharibacteria bacterium]|nr:aquaporin [Candidatus Saccharibacteria bacterium]
MKLSKNNFATFGAEFLGTGILVLMFMVLTQTTAVSYFIATSVAVAMAVIYMVFSGVSGGHANPAVTFGLWTARKISSLRAIGYIVAQLLGGLAAWGIYQYLVDRALPKVTTTDFNWRVFVAEAIGAGIFTLAFAAVLSRRDDKLSSAATIGAAFFVGIMIASLAARGLLNPAASLGISRFSLDWAYLLGPLAGGLVGVNLYTELFGNGAWLKAAKKKK